MLVAVNWGPGRACGYLRPQFSGLEGSTWLMADLLDPVRRYERTGAELSRAGVQLDLPGWRPFVVALTPARR